MMKSISILRIPAPVELRGTAIRLTGFVLLFLMAIFRVQAHDHTRQNAKLTLNMESVTVLAVMEAIESRTDFRFLYSEKDLDLQRKVTIRARKQSLETILATLFENTPITFRLLDRQIVLSAKPETVKGKAHIVPAAKAGELPPQQLVSGTVTTTEGQPLPGVNIIVKDRGHGTMSDENGAWSIRAAVGEILVFSFVGFKTREYMVEQSNTLDVVMEEDVSALDEVVVNAGYYKVSERNRTGSISRVTAEEIQDQPVTSPLMALQGRVPGLEISPANGNPGVAPKIRIRGENSLRVQQYGSGKSIPGLQGGEGGLPLYIVDGVPITSAPIISTASSGSLDYDPLATLNPENIASIEVLKDADATAIYGSRGANGIILITTKQGQMAGGKTEFQFNIYRGIGRYSTKASLLNTEEYLTMRYEALQNDGIDLESVSASSKARTYQDLTFWDQKKYTDWQDMFMGGTADITDIQGNFSGGNQNITYRFGGSYHREGLITPGNSHFNKITGHASINHRSTDHRFRFNITANYGITKHNLEGSGGGWVSEAMTLPPNAPDLYDENGELNWAIHPYTNQPTWDNPLARLNLTTNSDNRTLVVNGNLSYQFFSGLNAIINLGYVELNGKEIRKTPLTSMRPDRRYNEETGQGIRPSAQFNNNNRQSHIIESQLNYTKNWNAHALDILIGGSYQESKDERLWLYGQEYTADTFLGSLRGAGLITTYEDNKNEYRYAAVFGRVNYGYKDRYILNLTGRRDGSSRFGPGNRFGNFGAIGAAWIFSDEPWVKEHLTWFNFGKLRGSYGSSGNDQIGNYKYFDLYRLNTTLYQGQSGLIPHALYNPDYGWEKTRKLEAALEMGFLNNRLSLQASWYRNRSSNQLIARNLPYTAGFNSVIDNFSEAVVENSGWEFLCSGYTIRSENFEWMISLNLSINRNKLVSFSGIEDSPYRTVFKVGKPLSIQRIYTWEGIDTETGENILKDVDENGVINNEDKEFSNALDRDFYGGINQTIQYKGLALSFLFQFSKQDAHYLNGQMPGFRSNQPKLVLQRWQETGNITDVQRFSTRTLALDYLKYTESNGDIDDASFIRLKTLNISYRFSDQVVNKLGLKQLRLFIQGQNLLTYTSYKGPDPETRYGAPPIRMVTSGIQLTF